jgi:orotidine-5'-phosphate decarboxylase
LIFAGAKICTRPSLVSNRFMSADKIIVALDYDDPATAWSFIHQVKDHLKFFKVGSQLFTRAGPDFVRELRRHQLDVFLDLKYHDIPETVHQAVRAAGQLDVRLLTVHTSGGSTMMAAARAAAADFRTTLLGVTVLTSMEESSLSEINILVPLLDQVIHLAHLAQAAGLPGLVCSPLEITALRAQLDPHMILVTPGIRGLGQGKQDQKRTLSALEALRLGANHLVIGRPLTQAPDPLKAALALLTEIQDI